MRSHIRLQRRGPEIWWRVCELDDSPVVQWLPWEFPESTPIDRGGFRNRNDAKAFCLGVCWERAYHGLIPGVTVADIDAERAKLDVGRPLKKRLEAA